MLDTLKAAYFDVIGLAETENIIQNGYLREAIKRGKSEPFKIAWRGSGGHDVRGWAELLVGERALRPATAFPTSFGQDVLRYAQRVEQHWAETLRYRMNVAYVHEVKQVREATEWFLVHSASL